MLGELLGTVWVGAKPRSCVWVVLPHCNREENKEGRNKDLNECPRCDLYSSAFLRSILKYTCPWSCMSASQCSAVERSNIKILIIHLFTCWIYSSPQSPVCMGDFVFPDINWECHTEDSYRNVIQEVSEHVEDNFLVQVVN